MKLLHLIAVSSAAFCIPCTLLAQAAPQAVSGPVLSAGTIIYDPQGGEVGKIDSVASDTVVIDTGTNKATLPKAAFGSGAKGPTLSATKAQIDAQVAAATEKAADALTTALVPGAEVRGKAGSVIGTVKEVNGDQVVIDREAGPVSLTKNAFGLGSQGLVISLTAAELEAAAKAASSTS